MQKLIFIVDDTDANLTVAAAALEEEFRVLTMPSAQKMFALLAKKRPDLIVLDVEMPEMTGFEAFQKLKEDPSICDIPVIFLTGYCDENTKSVAEKLGALDILTKPIVAENLMAGVKKYISV